MNYYELFKSILKALKEGFDFLSEHNGTVDSHHIAELKGHLYTMGGYVEQLHSENTSLKVENNTLKKMLREKEEQSK